MSRNKEVLVKFFNYVIFFVSLSALVSCNPDDPKKCDEDFTTSYESMGDNFEKVYSATSGEVELNNLKSSIIAFLDEHRDVVCEIDGKEVNPTKEVLDFMDAIPESFTGMSPATIKVVYGDDDRINVSEASDRLQSLSRATAAQMSPDSWDEDFKLDDQTLGKRLSLCEGERFADEVSVARCSGFLVGPQTIVTAGHCVSTESQCTDFRWVFDYKDNPTSVDPKQIYKCESIVKQALSSTTSIDYAVIKLDRPVEDRKFFRVRSSGTAEVGDSLIVIGHPSGLSTKIAGNAQVRKNSDENFFVTNLDVFGGNSGSAVLSGDGSIVEGILVRGEQDYITTTGEDGARCRKVNECTETGCRGEDVTKMSVVEGIKLMGEFSAIEDGLYITRNFPVVEEGLQIDFLGYSFGSYTVGGLNFLDRCGIHYYENSDPTKWLDSHAGKCSDQDPLKEVVSAFSDQFYF